MVDKIDVSYEEGRIAQLVAEIQDLKDRISELDGYSRTASGSSGTPKAVHRRVVERCVLETFINDRRSEIVEMWASIRRKRGEHFGQNKEVTVNARPEQTTQ